MALKQMEKSLVPDIPNNATLADANPAHDTAVACCRMPVDRRLIPQLVGEGKAPCQKQQRYFPTLLQYYYLRLLQRPIGTGVQLERLFQQAAAAEDGASGMQDTMPPLLAALQGQRLPNDADDCYAPSQGQGQRR